MGTQQPASAAAERPARLGSLDAYRGFIMLVMASGGFGFVQVARSFPDNSRWRFLAHQFEHVPWAGCAFWDLIQPSFMFMVGVALPYSYASRRARGDSPRQIAAHAVQRAVILILLGIFLSSNGGRHTNFTFVNVLTQIGLGYTFLLLVLGRGPAVQLLTAGAILAGYWLYFFLHPAPDPGFNFRSVGGAGAGEQFSGLFAHWGKNTNAAAAFDVWFLNLFPRPEPFTFNGGGYQTLNFVPSLATMIFGVMTGELLRGPRPAAAKLVRLVVAGAVCLVAGWFLGQTVCPLVKRIWTPSWALFSTGWTLWLLAAFFAVIDLAGYRRWAFPLVVVGMNSIAMYCMAQLLKPWVRDTLRTHFGRDLFKGPYEPLFMALAVLGVLWLICLWLYRQKIFIRI